MPAITTKDNQRLYPGREQRNIRIRVLQRTGESLSLELKALQEKIEYINMELQTLKFIDLLDDDTSGDEASL